MAKFVPQAEMPLSDQVKVRRDKLEALRAEGLDPFVQTRFDVTSSAKEIKENFDAMEGKSVTLAGRLMSKRGMGKVSFCDLQDNTGRIQLYVRFDAMDEADFARFKKNDIGDIVGVEGDVFKTERGEISLRVHKATLLRGIPGCAVGCALPALAAPVFPILPLRLGLQTLDGQIDLAVVRTDDHDLYILPFGQVLANIADVGVGHLRNMYHSGLIFRQGDERAKIGDGFDFSL